MAYLPFTSRQKSALSRIGLGSIGSEYNLSSAEGLRQLARKRGYELTGKKERPTALSRLFGLLNVAETAPAAYAALEKKDPVKTYLGQIARRGTLKGYEPEVITYEDVLKKLGFGEGPGVKTPVGKLTTRGVTGTALDILLDPATYLGTGFTKLGREAAEKGVKEAGEAITTKAAKEVMEKGTHRAGKEIAEEVAERVPSRLGRTMSEQAALKQRALLKAKIPGLGEIPLIRGEKAYGGLEKLLGTFGRTKVAQPVEAIRNLFTTAPTPLKYADVPEMAGKMSSLRQAIKGAKGLEAGLREKFFTEAVGQGGGFKKLADQLGIDPERLSAAAQEVTERTMPGAEISPRLYRKLLFERLGLGEKFPEAGTKLAGKLGGYDAVIEKALKQTDKKVQRQMLEPVFKEAERILREPTEMGIRWLEETAGKLPTKYSSELQGRFIKGARDILTGKAKPMKISPEAQRLVEGVPVWFGEGGFTAEAVKRAKKVGGEHIYGSEGVEYVSDTMEMAQRFAKKTEGGMGKITEYRLRVAPGAFVKHTEPSQYQDFAQKANLRFLEKHPKALPGEMAAKAMPEYAKEQGIKVIHNTFDPLAGIAVFDSKGLYEKFPKVIDDLPPELEKTFRDVKPLFEKVKNFRDKITQRYTDLGMKELSGGEISYWVHTLSKEERDRLGKMLGWGSKEFNTKTPSDISRQIHKFIDESGDWKIDKLANYEPVGLEGVAAGLTYKEVNSLEALQKYLGKNGIGLRLKPQAVVRRTAAGYFDPTNKEIVIAAGRPLKDVISTVQHELSHAAQYDFAGKIDLMETLTKTGKYVNLRSTLDAAKNAARKEKEGIWKALNVDYKKLTPHYKKYYRTPTELLAFAYQNFKRSPSYAEELFPQTVKAIKNLEEANALLRRGSKVAGETLAGGGERFLGFFRNKKTGELVRMAHATIQEVNEGIGRKFFDTSVPVTSFVMGSRLAKKEAGHRFMNSVVKLGVDEADPPKGWVKVSDALQKQVPAMENLVFPQEIAEYAEKTIQAYTSDVPTKEVLKLIDKVQNAWKFSVTSLYPAFHVRNFIGNLWQNYLAGVTNPGDYAKAYNIRTKVATGKALTKVEQKIWDDFVGQGLKGFGFFGGDIEQQLAKKIDPSLTQKIFSTPRSIGEWTEEGSRLAHFINKMKKGSSAEAAAQSVKKFLFDYSDLTQVERNVFKRVIPFYTWTRKNIPLQLEMMVKQPGKFASAAKVLREMGLEKGEDISYLPEYMKEAFPIKIGGDEAFEEWVYGLGLPIEDLVKYAGGTPARTMEKAIGTLVSPFIKTPLEVATGRQMYFGKPLEEVDYVYPSIGDALVKLGVGDTLGLVERTDTRGKPYYVTTKPALFHTITATFPSRLMTTTGKLTREDLSGLAKILYGVFGLKVRTVEPEREKFWSRIEEEKDLQKQLERLGLVKMFETPYIP